MMAPASKAPRRARAIAGWSATILALVLVVSVQSHAGAVQPVRFGQFDSTPLGYLGCVRSPTGTFSACFVAYEEDGGVRLVFQGQGAELPPPAHIHEKYVEDVIVPAGSLRTFERDSSQEIDGMELVADLPRTGHIHLRSEAELAGMGATEASLICGIFYEIQSDQGWTVGGFTSDTGTVNGVQVIDNGCNVYFTGPVTGLWGMIVLPEEGTFPA